MAKVIAANATALAQHNKVQAQTPPSRRTVFVAPWPDFAPLTLEQFVTKFVTEREAQSLAVQVADHDAAIKAATPEDKARMVKILSQSDATKDAIRNQVDAL